MSTMAYARAPRVPLPPFKVQEAAVCAETYTAYPRDELQRGQAAVPFIHATSAQVAFTPTVGVVEACLLALKNEMRSFLYKSHRLEEAAYAIDPDVAFLLPPPRSVNITVRIAEIGQGLPSAVFEPEDFEDGSLDL